MNLKSKPGPGSKIIAGVVFLCSLTLPAHAMLVVSVACVTSNMDTTGGQTAETCDGSGTVHTSNTGLIPGEIITRGLSGGVPTSSFSTSASARADYGSLGVAGTASLVNDAVSSTDANFSTRTGSVSASSQATWEDQVTVGGAPGSFVDVLVNFVVDIHSFDISTFGGAAGNGFIRLDTNLSDQSFCMGIGGFCGPTDYALTLGTNLFSFTTRMAAGNLFTYNASFYGQVTAFQNISTDQDTLEVVNGMRAGSASTAYDALNTAQTYFTVLTPGATMSWASGHDYSAPVAVTPVPEPSTYALMLAGLGLVGWMGRRRKATQATAA